MPCAPFACTCPKHPAARPLVMSTQASFLSACCGARILSPTLTRRTFTCSNCKRQF